MGLVFSRNWDQHATWSATFVTDKIADMHLTGAHSHIAPLYIYNTNGNYDQNGNGFLFKDKEKKDNFTTGLAICLGLFFLLYLMILFLSLSLSRSSSFFKNPKPAKLCSRTNFRVHLCYYVLSNL